MALVHFLVLVIVITFLVFEKGNVSPSTLKPRLNSAIRPLPKMLRMKCMSGTRAFMLAWVVSLGKMHFGQTSRSPDLVGAPII